METVFMEYLDQLYWEGYSENFRDQNFQEYQAQLTAFICEHGRSMVKKNVKSKLKENGASYQL